MKIQGFAFVFSMKHRVAYFPLTSILTPLRHTSKKPYNLLFQNRHGKLYLFPSFLLSIPYSFLLICWTSSILRTPPFFPVDLSKLSHCSIPKMPLFIAFLEHASVNKICLDEKFHHVINK